MVCIDEGNAQPRTRTNAIIAALFLLLCSSGSVGTQAAVTDSIRFVVLDYFLNTSTPSDTPVAITNPIAAAVRAAADYYGVSTPPAGEFSLLADPLRIPDPLEAPSVHSSDLFNRMATELTETRLAYTISYPASFTEAEQSVAEAVVLGHPVLAIHPRPLLLFGYDYREPDPFWYVQRFCPGAETEILTLSQWRAEWWLWEPDPASVTLLEIAGRDTTARITPAPEHVLERILIAAKTDTAAGVTSYIRPILQLQDTLAKALIPPPLVNASASPADPLFLLQASAQRTQLQDYLRSLLPEVRDSTAGESLRLATYSAGKAAEQYAAAARELYGDSAQAVAADSATNARVIASRWVEHRLEAAKALGEAIRWERQMLAAIKDITAMKKPFRR